MNYVVLCLFCQETTDVFKNLRRKLLSPHKRKMSLISALYVNALSNINLLSTLADRALMIRTKHAL